MGLLPQASVSDVVTECNGTGTGPYTIFDVGGVTSGLISNMINESNMVLQSWVGIGSVSGDALLNEQIKRFETNYASAKVAATIIGIITVDGFNYSTGGLAVQRSAPKIQAYESFIKTKLGIAQEYIKMLHERFLVFNPTYPQGYTENGIPVQYWSTAPPRY